LFASGLSGLRVYHENPLAGQLLLGRGVARRDIHADAFRHQP